MNIKYSGYNSPDTDLICVAMCFFNPVGYKKPLSNIKIVIEEFKKYHIPYYVIELLYPGQVQIIKDSYVVRGDTVLFSKENLWNILEKKIPDKYEKIIFMDSDILFTDPDWLNKSYQLLTANDVIQSMEIAYKDIFSIEETIKLDPANLIAPQSKISCAKVIKNGLSIDLKNHHPGYTLGIDRNFLNNIGGFFEYCITGSGDLAFWSALSPEYHIEAHHLPSNIMEEYLKYKNNIYKYYSYRKRIDYISECISLHLNHGKKENRQYNDRQKYLPEKCDYFHNEDGVLQLANVVSKNKLINYWITRKEDQLPSP